MNNIAHTIDLAVLNPIVYVRDLVKACKIAQKYKLASVCVYPPDVHFVSMILQEHTTKTTTVIGFPFGNQSTVVKCGEAEDAICLGAEELDVVMCMSSFADKHPLMTMLDIQRVVQVAGKVPVKVIIETGHWNNSGIQQASKMVEDAGAAYVKTCTGFGPRGVTHEDIDLIAGGVNIPIKASGGIKTRIDAQIYIDQGCERLGIGIGSIEEILK